MTVWQDNSKVRPFTGVWIEMRAAIPAIGCGRGSPPHMGRIETYASARRCGNPQVSPTTGAMIETLRVWRGSGPTTISPHGGVDRNYGGDAFTSGTAKVAQTRGVDETRTRPTAV